MDLGFSLWGLEPGYQRAFARGSVPGYLERAVPRAGPGGDWLILRPSSGRGNLPRAVMEAMAAGKPVVASGVRPTRDLVPPEENKGTVLMFAVGKGK
ncbi:MAG: hypothetical protein HPY90_14950 [Syntrophothermus sp.]|uniref:glycosyltransferase n=1 Tax=Syntrophothermus sp. TaxID=2736299 RepID=UPI00257DE717|nr:hypothetical protein [Syntrophothermus sp.]NSW84509.1 hypothetical protein [Syntrophothermus sp.]